MKSKRIDDDTLVIYLSEMDFYDTDLNISQLFTTDQEVAHDVIYKLLKKVDPDGDFFNSGQLSIQVMPKDKGLVINIHKLNLPEDATADDATETATSLHTIDDLKSLMKVVDEMAEAQEEEDKEKQANRIAYILGRTQRLEDIIELAHLNIHWHTAQQGLYYNNGYYYVLLRYKKGQNPDVVNKDFMAAAEWLTLEARQVDEVLQDATVLMEGQEAEVMTMLDHIFK